MQQVLTSYNLDLPSPQQCKWCGCRNKFNQIDHDNRHFLLWNDYSGICCTDNPDQLTFGDVGLEIDTYCSEECINNAYSDHWRNIIIEEHYYMCKGDEIVKSNSRDPQDII